MYNKTNITLNGGNIMDCTDKIKSAFVKCANKQGSDNMPMDQWLSWLDYLGETGRISLETECQAHKIVRSFFAMLDKIEANRAADANYDKKMKIAADAIYNYGVAVAEANIETAYENGENSLEALEALEDMVACTEDSADYIAEKLAHDYPDLFADGFVAGKFIEDNFNVYVEAQEGFNGKLQEALFEERANVMADCVVAYQPQVDEEVERANEAFKRDNYAEALEALENIDSLCFKVLEECGGISGCYMVSDDGFFPDLSGLWCVSSYNNFASQNYEDMLSQMDILKKKIAA